jgi:cytochrome c-type biogenesis protein
MKDISFPLAFLAGLLSFLSPCVLPLIPSYVSFITGISFKDLTVGIERKRIRYLTMTNSLAFIAGFSSVFIGLGISSSAIGNFLFQYMDMIRMIGGVLVIIFGFFIAGFLELDFLMKEKKIHLSGKPAGYIGTFVVGMTFAAGWSPCIGPILGAILVYAGSKGSALYGFQLLAAY